MAEKKACAAARGSGGVLFLFLVNLSYTVGGEGVPKNQEAAGPAACLLVVCQSS